MDLARIEELIQITKDAKVSELTLRHGDSCVTVKKPAGATPKAAPPRRTESKKSSSPAAAEPSDAKTLAITAPMVGIFHAGPQPLLPGVVVRTGQVVGAIESMKLMNDVVSGVAGTVTEVDIEDGLPVEYGQILFHLAPLEAE
jgi:biotin carboxyl carrier protein